MRTFTTIHIRSTVYLAFALSASAALFLSACNNSNTAARAPKPKPNMPAEVATLFRNAYAMCKLDVLANEGVGTIAAYRGREEADAAATEISGMSSQSSEAYYRALLKLKKFQPRIVQIEVGRQYRLQGDQRAASLVQPVILRHINAVYTGIAISPADIKQDFESQRYRAYTPEY
jgi:hypothetical protein